MKKIFITATDTDAGKTFVACALSQALVNAGKRIAVYKPIAAGCQQIGEHLINEDAQLLSQFSNCEQTINNVNPIVFLEPIAPHIAAQKQQVEISLARVLLGFDKVKSLAADVIITEGAGGWRLPLILPTRNKPQVKAVFLSDFAKQSKQAVILVVNMKLGCLNHALLTYQAIIADGLQCIAWIANNASEQKMANLAENINSLEQLLPIPKMAQLSFYSAATMSLTEKINAAANEIDITPLL